MTNEELREKARMWLLAHLDSADDIKTPWGQRAFQNLTNALRDAYNAGLEDAIEKMRHDCVACEGSGIMPGCGPDEAECEYCGRPMSTVRTLKLCEGDDANG